MSSGDQRYPLGTDHQGLLSITWALRIHQALCKRGKAGALKTVVFGKYRCPAVVEVFGRLSEAS
jgi:hypothetical protein